MTAPRPTNVKVGYATYAIEWVDDENWPPEHPGDGGLTYAHASRILVRSGEKTDPMGIQTLREVLLHEIMHACWSTSMVTHTNWREETEVEETAIRMTNPVMLDVLRSNPILVKWLLEK